MNERIKQIIDICGLYLPPDNPEVLEKELEFFAESIVKKCAEIAKNEQAFNARYTDEKMHLQVKIDQCILIEFGL